MAPAPPGPRGRQSSKPDNQLSIHSFAHPSGHLILSAYDRRAARAYVKRYSFIFVCA